MNFVQIARTKNLIKLYYLVLGFELVLFLAGTLIPASAAGITASKEISLEKINVERLLIVIILAGYITPYIYNKYI